MADGYEIFDSGHNKRISRHQLLNTKQVDQVMVALRSLHLTGAEEARMVLLKDRVAASPWSRNYMTSNCPGFCPTLRKKSGAASCQGPDIIRTDLLVVAGEIASLVYADTLVSSFRLRPATAKPVRGELLTARVFLRGRFSFELCEETRHARPAPARPS
jgi:hypothetical protein